MTKQEGFPKGEQHSLSRRVIPPTIVGAVGGLVDAAGAVYTIDPNIPGSGIVNRAIEPIHFLPPTDAKLLAGGTIVIGGKSMILYGLSKIIPYMGELGVKAMSRFADFSSEGLIIATHKTSPTRKTDQKYNLPSNVIAGSVDFLPDGNISNDPDKTSLNLLRAITGLQQYFAGVDDDIYPEPQYLYGKTNESMARFVKRLGGTVIFQYQGNRIRNARFGIVGETKVIRKNLEELVSRKSSNGKTIIEILRSRSVARNSK